MKWKMLAAAAIVAGLGLVGAEAALHLTGFGSYPVYDLDGGLRYVPAANQSGRFLNRNAWFFNDRRMGNADNWTPTKHPNVLLVGNSVVLGGLPYDQADKLGPLLERSMGNGAVVWSAAAGGWSNINEMAYLDRNRDVIENADVVIWEFMSGGLSAASEWPGYYIFPDHKPLFLAPYVIGKYVLPYFGGRIVNDSGALPPTGETDDANLRRFRAMVALIAKSRKLVIFMYPSRADLQDRVAWAEAVAPIVETCRMFALSCVDFAKEPVWTESLYRDGVHPTVEGNKRLASRLAEVVK